MSKKYCSWLFIAALFFVGGCDNSDSSDPEHNDNCHPQATRCFSGNLQTCNADRNWENTPCLSPQICSEDSGTAECASPDPQNSCEPDQKRCHEGVMQTCSANKVWEDTPCTLPKVCSEESGTATCADAAASEDCTAGEIKCVDDGTTAELWTCNESKSWVKKPCPASTVSGARLTCRNAETCSTYLCTTPGMYFNSASKSCDNFNPPCFDLLYLVAIKHPPSL